MDRVVLISGDEELLVSRAVAGYLRAAKEQDAAAEITELEGSGVDHGDLSAAASPSMFGGLRVVVIRNLQDLPEEQREPLIALIGYDLDDLLLVLCHPGGVKGKKIVEAVKGSGARVVPAVKITKRGELLGFIGGEINGAGRRMSDDGRVALLESIGPDLRELAAACAQLVADTEGVIDSETVAQFHSGRAETKGYEVADAALNGDIGGALGLLASGMESGLAPVLVTASFAGQLRELIAVQATGGRGVAGMPPWRAEKLARTAQRWTTPGLARAVLAVATADAAVKGVGVDATQALHSMIVEIRRAWGINAGASREAG